MEIFWVTSARVVPFPNTDAQREAEMEFYTYSVGSKVLNSCWTLIEENWGSVISENMSRSELS